MNNLPFIVLGSAILTYCLIGGFAAFAKKQANRIRSLHAWQSRFERQVTVLAEIDCVPKSVFQTLESINSMIGERDMPLIIYFALKSKINREGSEGSHKSLQDIEAECDEHLKAKVKLLYGTAVFAGLLSLTYSDYFWGVSARAVLAEQMADCVNPGIVVRKIRRESFERNPGLLYILTSRAPSLQPIR